MLADEPTGELDRVAADAVFALIGELAREAGTTVIVVSHDPRAAEFAERAIRIRDGRVSEERRDGAEQIVVGRGGWIRLPEEVLRGAGVGTRAALSGSRTRDRRDVRRSERPTSRRPSRRPSAPRSENGSSSSGV